MVRKITIFEPHFEDVQFGPTSLEGVQMDSVAEAVDPEAAAEMEEPGAADVESMDGGAGRSLPRRLLPIGALLAAIAIAGLALRRRNAEDAEPIEIDASADEETPVEPETER